MRGKGIILLQKQRRGQMRVRLSTTAAPGEASQEELEGYSKARAPLQLLGHCRAARNLVLEAATCHNLLVNLLNPPSVNMGSRAESGLAWQVTVCSESSSLA